MMRRRHIRRIIGAAVTLLLVEGLVGTMAAVGAAEGQLTRIGGNSAGCPTDAQVLEDLQKPREQRSKPPTAIGSDGYKIDQGMQGIASDISGQGLYLLTSGRILGRTSVIAGAEGDGSDADGVAGKDARLNLARGIAVDPLGKSLWIVEWGKSATPRPPGRIRRVDLTTSTHEITTVAQTLGPQPSSIAADARGNLYVTETNEGMPAVSMFAPGGVRTGVPSTVRAPSSIAVDVTGTEIYVAGDGGVYRLQGGSTQLVAGPTIANADGTPPVSVAPDAVAIGHETDGQTIGAKYLYIADGARVLRVDLKASSPVITTVAGGGSAFVSSTAPGLTARFEEDMRLAADMAGHVFIADPNQCAIFQLETPLPFRVNTIVTNPPAVTNTTLPNTGGRTGDADKTVPDQAGATNNTQTDGGTAGQQAPGPQSRTEIVPGSQTNLQPQPQTELRIIDQGNAVTAPNQVAQPTVDAMPTQAGAAQFTPTPAATPTPTPTPASDAGTVTLVDPGTSNAVGVGDPSTAVPIAPAPAAVPPPPSPASAPPPAAPQPVSNVGLAHGDTAAPARGATRYAMVRNDEEQSVAGLAMAGAGAMVGLFLCVIFVAPGASSKPKPRPKGAY